MYIFSKTPESPLNPVCAANVGAGRRTHVPLKVVGSDLEQFTRKIACHDGGVMLVCLCRLCGVMYYRTMGMEESIVDEVKNERGGLSERYLRSRITRDYERGVNAGLLTKFDKTVAKLVEAGTIQSIKQDDGTVVFTWGGDD